MISILLSPRLAGLMPTSDLASFACLDLLLPVTELRNGRKRPLSLLGFTALRPRANERTLSSLA
jgi:hypothetical protein